MVEEVRSKESFEKEFLGLVGRCFGEGHVLHERLVGYSTFYELKNSVLEKAGCLGRIYGERDRVIETKLVSLVFCDPDMGGVKIWFMNQFQPVEIHVHDESNADKARRLAEEYEKFSGKKATIVREY